MNKPESLRAALVAALPELALAPDKLAVFVDEGALIATGTRSLSFEMRYVINVLVMDFAGDANRVFIALIEWARAHQPDLVTNAHERQHGITFEADRLNHDTADLSIKVAVTENVAVSTGLNGERIVTSVDDAAQMWVAYG